MSSPGVAPGVARVAVGEGVELNCLEWNLGGSAVPVLLIHGLASNALLWSGVAALLADAGHPVVALDQRGHGRSSKPGTGYDFATLTADLVRVLEHYGWVPGSSGGSGPFVAGQSWGANVVLELAVRHPSLVGGLVLVDGGTGDLADSFADWPTCSAALAPPALAGMPAQRLEALMRGAHPGWSDEALAATMANLELMPDGTVRPWLAYEDHMVILRNLWEHRPSERFPDVGVPVLIIPADDPSNDRWMSTKRASVARANASIPRSVTRWITGDHDLHAQYPDQVAGLIDAATRPGFFS